VRSGIIAAQFHFQIELSLSKAKEFKAAPSALTTTDKYGATILLNSSKLFKRMLLATGL
jgi:hypothetical protein